MASEKKFVCYSCLFRRQTRRLRSKFRGRRRENNYPAGRILPKLRGQGLLRNLERRVSKYTEEHFPSVLRQRYTTTYADVDRNQEKLLLELDNLGYEVEQSKLCGKAKFSTSKQSTEIELCSKQYLSGVVLSLPVVEKLFPDNVIIVNGCPFSPLRSNIDYMLQESDVIFVEQCAGDVLPRSLSIGTLMPRVKYVQWLACIYTDDPTLFEAHLLRQFKCACDRIRGDFVFLCFQDKRWTPLVRNVMEEQLQQIKFSDRYHNTTLKLYETRLR